MSVASPIPEPLWQTVPPEAQEALRARFDALERRISDLEQRLNKTSTNSSRPPSSDPPSVKRRPPVRPSGKQRGGQPNHRHHARALVPPEGLRQVIEGKPRQCRRGGVALPGDDPEPIRPQVAEVPPLQPVVDEYRLHRLRCPHCRPSPCAP